MMPHPPDPRHVVVARAGKAGDLLLSLPVFQTLRSNFPGARITALIGPSAKATAQGHPAIDRIEILEEAGIFKTADQIRQLGADIFILLHPDPKLVLAAWLAKVPVRIGPAARWHALFQTHSPKIERSVCDRHEVEYNLDLLRPLGISRFAEKIEFPINQVDRNKAIDFLKERGLAEGVPYVVLHPGSKGTFLNWKPEKYAQIALHLCQVKNLRVVITGEAQELPLISQVTAFLFNLPQEQKPVLITGELGLKPLAAVIQGALCLLSGSTGEMHLAAAVGTPTVSIFSPAPEATPVRWGPWGNESTLLIPNNPDCTGCQVGYCKKHDPMEALTAAEVFNAMEKYVRRSIRE